MLKAPIYLAFLSVSLLYLKPIMFVYSEMYGAEYGMGFFVKKYSEFGLYDRTWAGFLFLGVVLMVVMQIFEKIKKRILRWTM